MTGNDLTSIYAEVYNKYVLQPPAEGEFSVRQFAEANNLTYNRASLAIQKAVADGLLEELADDRIMTDGKRATCYRRKVSPDP